MSRRRSLVLPLVALWGCVELPDGSHRSIGGRTVLPRFSNSTAHHECVDEERGVCAAGRASRDPAAARLDRAGRRGEHRRLVEMLTRMPGPLAARMAVAGLERLSATAPGPEILSDLAAAELLLGKLDDSPQRLLSALELIDRALHEHPGSPATLFNKALICEAWGLVDCSRAAWLSFLEIESDEAWLEEARSRLDALEAPAAGGAPDRPSASAATACAGGDSPHLRFLDDLERLTSRAEPNPTLSGVPLADCLPAARTSSLAREARELVEGLARGEVPIERLEGLRRYLDALAALQKNDLPAAQRLLDRAVGLLGTGTTSIDGWLSLLQASIDFYEQRATDVVARTEALIAARPEDGWLLYRAHWIAGVAQGRLGALSRSYRHYAESLEALEGLGETIDTATLLSRRAEVLQLLGYRRRAWESRLAALLALSAFEHHSNRVSVLWEAGLAASQEGRQGLASSFLAEASAAVALSPADIRRPQIASLRAEVLAALGRTAAAAASLDGARAAIEALPRGAIRDRAAALADEAAAVVLLERGRPEAAARAFTPLVLDAEERGLDVDLLRLYGRRASAARRLGDAGAELADLRAAAATALGIRRRVDAPLLDHAFSASVEASFARLVFLTATAGRDPARALEIFDSSRAFRHHQPAVASGSLEGPGSRLPSDTAVVAYSLHDEELLSWFLSREGLRSRRTAVPEELLRALARLERGAPSPTELERLHALLVEPWAEPLAQVQRLLVLPDRHLAGVPYAALRSSETGEPVVSSLAVGIVPRLFGPPRESTASARRRVVVVGAAAAPSPPFERLGALPRVADETARVRSAYEADRASVVTADSFGEMRAAVEGASILHFAGHAVSHPDDPLVGYLLLSDPAGPGQISGQELGRWNLEALDVAVLSACSTIESRANGFLPLSIPLLEAGAGSVIGNLWPVEDRMAGDFAAALHRSLAAGASPVTALRAAQLELMAKRPLDSSWAGWQALVSPPFPEKHHLGPSQPAGDRAR